MSNFSYLLLEIFDPYDGKHKYFCGFKKFFNYSDGYIGTNPHQYAIPGGEKKKKESYLDGAMREFHEEIGFNISKLANNNNIELLWENKCAKIYKMIIPYYYKNLIQYDKNKIRSMNEYIEFEFLDWFTLDSMIKKFKEKCNFDLMVELYINNILNFKNNGKLEWLYYQKELTYNKVINGLKNNEIGLKKRLKNLLKIYLKKRSLNDWFIEAINVIR